MTTQPARTLFALVCLSFFLLLPTRVFGQSTTLTTDSIVQMLDWKISPTEIIATINRNRSTAKFNLSTETVKKLRDAGATPEIISAIVGVITLAPDGSPAPLVGTDKAAADKAAADKTAANKAAADKAAADKAAADKAAADKAAADKAAADKAAADSNGASKPAWSSAFTRITAGVDISGASSFPTQQRLFADFNLSLPIPFIQSAKVNPARLLRCKYRLKSAMDNGFPDPSILNAACRGLLYSEIPVNPSKAALQREYDLQDYRLRSLDRDPTNNPWWVWLNPRITSVPQTTTSLLSNVASSNPTINSLLTSNYNQIVQGLEVIGGIERVLNSASSSPGAGSARPSFSYFVSAGFLTPFTVTQQNANEFNLPSTLSDAQIKQVFNGGTPPNPICKAGQTPSASTPCTNVVAYLPANRTRFYYQYYTGFRMKTFIFKSASKDSAFQEICKDEEEWHVCPIFPNIFEIGVGQNSSVSGGQLRGWILRNQAFFTFPFWPPLHLFFDSWIHVTGHNVTMPPVILDTTSPPVAVTTLGVGTVPVEAPNRDFYRLGAAVDLITLAKYIKKKNVSSASAVLLDPTKLEFKQAAAGSKSDAQNVKLKNTGKSDLTITDVAFDGADAKEFAVDNKCGKSVSAGGSCDLVITFQPRTDGSKSASLRVTDDAADSPQTIPVSGTATKQGAGATVTLSEKALDFKQIAAGSKSQPKTVTVKNTGKSDLTITDVAFEGADVKEFTVENKCRKSLAAGSSCDVVVTFEPKTAGSKSAFLKITDDAPDSPQKIEAVGTGQ